MQTTPIENIKGIHEKQQDFFSSHKTKEIDFRIEQLKNLRTALKEYEKKILAALWKDLHKSAEEAYLTEIGIVLMEIDLHIKKLRKWSRAQKVSTPVHLLPSSSKIYYEPLGVAVIIAPWNYPFQLLINPLVGAISAGCCVVLKPSEFTPNVARIMEEMIENTFDDNYITLLQGGQEVGEALLKLKFDKIFFTGSTRVGKLVMKAAAENLTPVILELGGKSPCIVDHTADVGNAAKRIIWGKTINAGQTCIAPDYLLVHNSVKEELVQKMEENLQEMYGGDIVNSKYYPRIVNQKTFDGLEKQIKNSRGKLRFGGRVERENLFISPTVFDNITPDDVLMQEEIFGPILPVMTYTNIEEALDFINSREKPLALYYFGKGNFKEVLKKTSSGGAAINDTLMHIANHNLPFGGVGYSGQGSYHGRRSFLAFSHERAVVTTPTWIDLPFRYPPFKFFDYIKRFLQ